MSRAVYIGGFGNGRSVAAGVGEVLSNFYEDVEVKTFSEAYADAQDPNRSPAHKLMLNDAAVFTHSAGLLSVVGFSPKEIHAFNGPLPLSRSRLLARTAIKTARMHNPRYSFAEWSAIAGYDASAIGELAAHPIRNLKPFLNRTISNFDSLDYLSDAAHDGIRSVAQYSDSDKYYRPQPGSISVARWFDVTVPDLIVGEHDVLPLTPQLVLPGYIQDHV